MAINNVQIGVRAEVVAEIPGADPCNVEVKVNSKTKSAYLEVPE